MRRGKSWRNDWAARLAAMSDPAPPPDGVQINRAPLVWWDEATNITPEMVERVLATKPPQS